uniref:Neurotransmitter-gated ion-channel ligand-binding domain-containing protein n=1 Tax=Tetranychus urticae TaxID=32264 RepID=T1JX82_TETUR
MWIDEKKKFNSNAKVVCPQCQTEYILIFPPFSEYNFSINQSSFSPNPDEPLTLYNKVKIVHFSALDTTEAQFDVDLFLIQSWFLNKSVCQGYSDLHNNYSFKAPLVAVDGTTINPMSTYTDGFLTIYQTSRIKDQCMVKFMRRLSITVECKLDFRRFPKDTQICPIDLTSAFWSMSTLHYIWDENPIEFRPEDLDQNNYRVNITASSRIDTAYDGKTRSWLTLQFKFDRKISHFILEITVPSILIIISAYFSFFISIDTGSGRFAFSARPLFNLIVLYSSYKTYLPPLSYVNAGDIWMLGNICFGFFTIIIVAFNVHLGQTKKIKSTAANNSNANTPSEISFAVDNFTNANTNNNCTCNRFRHIFILKHFRCFKCKVHPMPKPILLKSQHYDKMMRVFYPTAFIIFNIVYWLYLL